MSSGYGPSDQDMVNPVKNGGLDTDKMAAAIVIGALVFLIAVNRGFRGVSVSHLSGGMVRS